MVFKKQPGTVGVTDGLALGAVDQAQQSKVNESELQTEENGNEYLLRH
jgi:hypothetical protein